jgi:thiamine pyrophosphate-dependent acetolactate synthase large subunit-like protein
MRKAQAATSAIGIPAYEALARDIRSRGFTTVFGLMSDDTALFVTTLDSMGVRFYGARHENTAIAMAEGYAAATGELGMVIIGRGPATANALHGAMYAHRTGSRVLLIFGASSLGAAAGPDAKEFNALGVLHAAGISTFVAANPEGARRTLENAIDATAQGGCVALLLPMNVQLGSVDYPGPMGIPAASAPAPFPRTSARPVAIDAAIATLGRSRRPLFVVGLGAYRSGARAAIEALADRVGAVIATTLKGKDMFRGYPYHLGIVGSFSHAAGRRLIDQADCILAFGASLNQRTTSYGTSLPKDVPLIHIDISAAPIGRLHPADIALIADARTAAEQLVADVPERAASDKPFHTAENRRLLAEHDMANEFQSADTPRTMDPRSLAIALDQLLPADRNAVYDAGNFLQVIPYISGHGPDHIKNTVDFASIGMGFGTALGFARGTPGRTTVLFVGDGGFLMTMGELETTVREDVPLVIVLMNDCAYGAELHFLKMRGMPVSKSVFLDIDFAPVAAAFGFQAHTVRTLDDLRQLAPLLQNPEGPILLDCKINASVAAPYHTETFDYERRKG